MILEQAQTRIVRLTPPGRGAVASILLVGPKADRIFAQCWIGPPPIATAPVFGRFRLRNTEQLEEIVVHTRGPKEIEIHCHGGDVVVGSIEQTLSEHGGDIADWVDVFCPAKVLYDRFLDSGTSDTAQEHTFPSRSQLLIVQREMALSRLPFAPTERTAQILLDQYNGALEWELDRIDRLTNPADRLRSQARLRENAVLGPHLVQPFQVVLAGAVNAGKSSLMNAMLGYNRAIVADAPGTTRDVVSVQTALEGFPVTFHDTAGFRTTDEALEQVGIERSTNILADADLVVWLVDPLVPKAECPPVPQTDRILICHNKIDLLPPNGPSGAHVEMDNICAVSAVTGLGVEDLLREIFRRLMPHPPIPLEAVPLALALSRC